MKALDACSPTATFHMLSTSMATYRERIDVIRIVCSTGVGLPQEEGISQQQERIPENLRFLV